MTGALIDSNLHGLQLLNRGKVRDVYATSDPNLLLFVASDRISAYDVILRNVRPVPVLYCSKHAHGRAIPPLLPRFATA